MKIFNLFIVTMILYSCSANKPKHSSDQFGEACLRYEPEKSQLIGRLYQKSFPGPPNYEDINKGDKKETYWFIKLKEPVCVEDVKNQMDIQIVISRVRNQLKKSMIGNFAILKGELFPQMTGHHRTQTLISADSIEIINE